MKSASRSIPMAAKRVIAAALISSTLTISPQGQTSSTPGTDSNSPMVPIGHNQTSSVAPEAVNYFGMDIYAYRSNDQTGHIWYSVADGPPQLIGGNTATLATPEVIILGATLYIFHTGIDGGIYYDTFSTQGTFDGNWRRMPGMGDQTNGELANVSTGPAVTEANGNLVVGFTSTSGRMYWNTLAPSGATHGWDEITPGGITNHTFTLSTETTGEEDVVAIHTGTDGRLYDSIGILENGEFFFGNWQLLPGGGLSNNGPASLALPTQGELYVGVQGNDSHAWAAVFDEERGSRTLTIDPNGPWRPQTNAGSNSVFTSTRVGMAYLRGDAPSGFTNPTMLVAQEPSGLIVRKQLN